MESVANRFFGFALNCPRIHLYITSVIPAISDSYTDELLSGIVTWTATA